MHYTGKECDVSPYTEAYEAIKSVPIVQAATAYDNRDTGTFAEVYPMAQKADAGLALKSFIMDFGVPEDLTTDGSREQNSKGTEFMKSCRRNNIRVTRTEPERPN
jgi:hypothetical protein